MYFSQRIQKVIKNPVDKTIPTAIVHQIIELFFADELTLGFGIKTFGYC